MLNQQKCEISGGQYPQNGEKRPRKLKRNDDFRRELRESGLSQGAFAKHIDTHPNTVSRWMNNETEISGAALAYLRLFNDLRAITRRIDGP